MPFIIGLFTRHFAVGPLFALISYNVVGTQANICQAEWS